MFTMKTSHIWLFVFTYQVIEGCIYAAIWETPRTGLYSVVSGLIGLALVGVWMALKAALTRWGGRRWPSTHEKGSPCS
jgi:hypothetical protein